jgi:ParB family chromosome partitioning protein
MAKVSGLMSSGKIGKADQKVIDAMPDAPAASLDSSILAEIAPDALALDSSIASSKAGKSTMLDSSTPKVAITELAVALVRPSPFQVRAVADSDYIETLMASIVQSGVISPVVVRMLDSSSYEVIAGHHRLEACRRLGHINVPVVVRHMTDSEAACALASDNFVRKELSDYERFKHAKLLKDHEFCKTNSEIGQVLGVSRQLVGFLFAFEDFPAGAKAILEVNPKILGATQANELKDIAREEPDVFTEAIALLAENKIRQNQIRTWIESKFKTSSVRMQRRQEIRITRPGLRSPIKLTYTDREAKIQADGLDVGRLKKLIEDNLDSLITQ